MSACHPKSARAPSLPGLWLMTDERVAEERLLAAISALPRGGGVIVRHHMTPAAARRALLARIARRARQRGLVLVCSAMAGGAAACTDGWHISARKAAGRAGAKALRKVRRSKRRGLLTMSAHDAREVARANAIGADLLFISPIFPTRSHAGARTLGPLGFARLARLARAPVIALGGMTARRFARVRPLGAHGWAAIDALT